MDFERLERQFRTELFDKRKALLALGIAVLLMVPMAMIGGYLLLRHAVEENRVTIGKAIDTPTNTDLLLADHAMGDLLYHIVFFHKVHLDAGPTDDVYFAQSDGAKPVLIIAQGSTTRPDEGEVNIKGTVRPLPDVATMKQKWKLSKEQVKTVRAEGIYVDADSIRGGQQMTERVATK